MSTNTDIPNQSKSKTSQAVECGNILAMAILCSSLLIIGIAAYIDNYQVVLKYFGETFGVPWHLLDYAINLMAIELTAMAFIVLVTIFASFAMVCYASDHFSNKYHDKKRVTLKTKATIIIAALYSSFAIYTYYSEREKMIHDSFASIIVYCSNDEIKGYAVPSGEKMAYHLDANGYVKLSKCN